MKEPDLDVSHLIERADVTEEITGIRLDDSIIATRKSIRGKHGNGRYRIIVKGTIISTPKAVDSALIRIALYDQQVRVMLTISSSYTQGWDKSRFADFSVDCREYSGSLSRIKIWVANGYP
jgi:hypothetical protein